MVLFGRVIQHEKNSKARSPKQIRFLFLQEAFHRQQCVPDPRQVKTAQAENARAQGRLKHFKAFSTGLQNSVT